MILKILYKDFKRRICFVESELITAMTHFIMILLFFSYCYGLI